MKTLFKNGRLHPAQRSWPKCAAAKTVLQSTARSHHNARVLVSGSYFACARHCACSSRINASIIACHTVVTTSGEALLLRQARILSSTCATCCGRLPSALALEARRLATAAALGKSTPPAGGRCDRWWRTRPMRRRGNRWRLTVIIWVLSVWAALKNRPRVSGLLTKTQQYLKQATDASAARHQQIRRAATGAQIGYRSLAQYSGGTTGCQAPTPGLKQWHRRHGSCHRHYFAGWPRGGGAVLFVLLPVMIVMLAGDAAAGGLRRAGLAGAAAQPPLRPFGLPGLGCLPLCRSIW